MQPTWRGYVGSTHDALVLFEACLQGQLPHVPRRPHDRERTSLICSGSVFIYEENASGIKRWTDGVAWSPSRILGNFLIYRELMKPFPPGEKKRATKRGKRPTRPGEPYSRPEADDVSNDNSPTSPSTEPSTPIVRQSTSGPTPTSSGDTEMERQLIGSLVDSYGFKTDGLVKKTMSVTVNGVHHHLVSYYKVEDVMDNKLERPSTPSATSRLRSIRPRPELIMRQNFRAPMEEAEDGVLSQNDPRRNSAAFHFYGERRTDMYMGQSVYYSQQHGMQPQQPFYGGLPTSAIGPAYAAQQPYSGQLNYPMTTMSASNIPYMPQPTAPSHIGAEAYQSYGPAPYASLESTNRAVPPISLAPTLHTPHQQQQPQQEHPQQLQYPGHLVRTESSAMTQNATATLSPPDNYYSPQTMTHQPSYPAMNSRWAPQRQPDTPPSYQNPRSWPQPGSGHDGVEGAHHSAHIPGWGTGS